MYMIPMDNAPSRQANISRIADTHRTMRAMKRGRSVERVANRPSPVIARGTARTSKTYIPLTETSVPLHTLSVVVTPPGRVAVVPT